MKIQAINARVFAYNTAIDSLRGWECDPEEKEDGQWPGADEQMKHAKILADRLERELTRFVRKYGK